MWTAERQLPGGNDSQWTGKKPKSQSNGLGNRSCRQAVKKKRTLHGQVHDVSYGMANMCYQAKANIETGHQGLGEI